MGEERYNSGVVFDVSRRFPDHTPSHDFRVLSWDAWEFWRKNGYVVVPDVVPLELCQRVAAVLWDFLDADPDDPSTWYELAPHTDEAPSRRARAGMLEIYHHQALWDVRQHPAVHDVFVDLWGTEHLWVTIDRGNLNVPADDDHWRFDGFIHWDIDPTTEPMPMNMQGIVTLTDTTAGMGGLQVVPELFRDFDELARRQREAPVPTVPDVTGCEVIEVESRAGDLVVWDSRLPHGTGRNRSDRPRLAQYVSMVPAEPADTELLDLRLESFRSRTAPALSDSMRGDRRELELGDPPVLTPLGERLLGISPWE